MIIVGDSAGANLAVAVAMKLAEQGIRKPDGVLSIYGCLLIHYIPSPSRILALMDPLLPLGVLPLCLDGKSWCSVLICAVSFLAVNSGNYYYRCYTQLMASFSRQPG